MCEATMRMLFLFQNALAAAPMAVSFALAGNAPGAGGFHLSYRAGAPDAAGKHLGGTEIIHLAAHGGKLYAATGMWMDEPGADPKPGPQVLSLDQPGDAWRLDHEFSLATLRITALASVSFATDGAGRPLERPVSLLLAAPTGRVAEATVHARDDASGAWMATSLSAQVGPVEVRSLFVHRDRATGVDRILAGCSPAGIVSGVYDPSAPGRIRWEKEAEYRQEKKRVMSIAECDGVVHAAIADSLYRRIDGPAPRWEKVYTSSAPVANPKNSGLRALTAIPNPSGKGQVLLAALEGEHGRVLRLDPADGYKERIELDVNEFLHTQWNVPVRYSITAYNDMLPVVVPGTDEAVRLLGIEAYTGPSVRARPHLQGWEGGAWYLIRHTDGRYELRQIADPSLRPAPLLISTRTIAVSPFPGDAGKVLYLGGYDANFIPAHNTAWIFRADLDAIVGGP
ncbi:MAG: hypothetical protein NTW86_10400 [Candidatus Sumerlaeota bacterium]|nr:hypothetical protein [Candidatus Sumerlaeota bacterium]